MKKTDEIINRTATLYATGTYNPNEVLVAIDPATITLITPIVIEIIKIIVACRKSPDEAVAIINSPEEVEVAIVKKVVRRRLGFWRYWWSGGKIIQAILDSGKYSSESEVEMVYKET